MTYKRHKTCETVNIQNSQAFIFLFRPVFQIVWKESRPFFFAFAHFNAILHLWDLIHTAVISERTRGNNKNVQTLDRFHQTNRCFALKASQLVLTSAVFHSCCSFYLFVRSFRLNFQVICMQLCKTDTWKVKKPVCVTSDLRHSAPWMHNSE